MATDPRIYTSLSVATTGFFIYFFSSWVFFLLNEFGIISWGDLLYELFLNEHPSITSLEISIAIVGSVILLGALICCFTENKFSIIWLITAIVFLFLNMIYVVYSKGIRGLNGDFERIFEVELENQLHIREIPIEFQNRARNDVMEKYHDLLGKLYFSVLKTVVLTICSTVVSVCYTIKLKEKCSVDGKIMYCV